MLLHCIVQGMRIKKRLCSISTGITIFPIISVLQLVESMQNPYREMTAYSFAM
jgi:hypothetical protein